MLIMERYVKRQAFWRRSNLDGYMDLYSMQLKLILWLSRNSGFGWKTFGKKNKKNYRRLPKHSLTAVVTALQFSHKY